MTSPSTRPDRLVLVAGTGTEVGKTWIAAQALQRLRWRGVRVAARKPAQSFDIGPTDAEVLADATGEPVTVVCPAHRCYPLAMAPFMAADALGLPPFTLAELAGEIGWPSGVEVGVVETAGGLRSPMASDGGDALDLIDVLHPDVVVLVADAGLGTINAVRLCVSSLGEHAGRCVVVLNRFDPADDLHQRNRDWLRAHLAGPRVVSAVDELVSVLGPMP